MRRLLAGSMIMLLVSGALPAAYGQEHDPEAIAQALVDALIAGNYGAATAHFSPEVSAALSQEALQQGWEQIQAQIGPFQEQIGSRVDFDQRAGNPGDHHLAVRKISA